MKTTYIYPIVLVVVFVILGTVYAVRIGDNTAPASYTSPESMSTSTTVATPEVQTQTTPTTPTPTSSTSFTSAQVATHASEASCWTSINGNVYDVTSWISKHPGGKRAILSLCGHDGTAAFEGQHGGQARPESELASFKIGTLTN